MDVKQSFVLLMTTYLTHASAEGDSCVAPEYDYIVVGSGPGGGPVALNLAKAGYQVLLIEAGSNYEDENIDVPAYHPASVEDPRIAWDYQVRHYDPERNPAEIDTILYPRSAVLGGCASHNALFTMYPHKKDFDRLAKILDDDSFLDKNMRKYFQRLEGATYVGKFVSESGHGRQGYLKTSLPDFRLLLGSLGETVGGALGGALAAAFGSVNPLNLPKIDINGVKSNGDPVNDQEMAYLIPMNTDGYQRWGIANALREFVKSNSNLHILYEAFVEEVLMTEERVATGVRYSSGTSIFAADPRHIKSESRKMLQAYARREVVLSAGTFNTPQLLKLSGVGPASELAEHNIAVRVDLPGVGANLHDRYEIGVVSELKRNISMFENCSFDKTSDVCLDSWRDARSSGSPATYSSNGAIVGISRKSDPSLETPDILIFGLPVRFNGYFKGWSKLAYEKRNIFSWLVLKGSTKNRSGTVKLNTSSRNGKKSDPALPPDIHFHYFEGEGADEDLDGVVKGIKMARELNKSLFMGKHIEEEIEPGPQVETDDQLREYVRKKSWGHHACGTSKMGPADDEMAVLNNKFEVRGVSNLRVVDASVFPDIPGFFIAVAIYMMAEKASDEIIADADAALARSSPARSQRREMGCFGLPPGPLDKSPDELSPSSSSEILRSSRNNGMGGLLFPSENGIASVSPENQSALRPEQDVLVTRNQALDPQDLTPRVEDLEAERGAYGVSQGRSKGTKAAQSRAGRPQNSFLALLLCVWVCLVSPLTRLVYW